VSDDDAVGPNSLRTPRRYNCQPAKQWITVNSIYIMPCKWKVDREHFYSIRREKCNMFQFSIRFSLWMKNATWTLVFISPWMKNKIWIFWNAGDSGCGLLANFSGGGYLPGCVSWRTLEIKLGATVFFAEYGNSSKWIRLTLCGVRFPSIWQGRGQGGFGGLSPLNHWN